MMLPATLGKTEQHKVRTCAVFVKDDILILFVYV